MRVTIEKRKADNEGKQALRLAFYLGSSIDPDTGKRIKHRKREALDLYLFETPKTPSQRQHNKDTLKLVESIKAKRLIESESDKYGLSDTTKMNASFLDYFRRIAETKTSRSNLSIWMGTLKHLQSYHGKSDLTFEQVTVSFLEGFKNYLLTQPLTKSKTKLSTNTAFSYFNKVKATLNQAHATGVIRDNPARLVSSVKVAQNKREYLTVDELRALAQAECRYEVLKRAFLFSCLSGLRWSDVQKLTWSEVQCIDDHHRIVFNQKKTGGLQYLDLGIQASSLMGERQHPDERVFKGLKYSAWHNIALLQWVMRAGIHKHITFHSARHTFAVLQLTNGTDIYTVSKLLGHTELRTTQIYADIIEEKRREAMHNLPEISL